MDLMEDYITPRRTFLRAAAVGNGISISAGAPWFVPIPLRQRMLARALSFKPDIGASVPTALAVEERLAPLGKKRFTILDVIPEDIRVRQFAWRLGDPEEHIESLEPIIDFKLTPAHE